MDDARAVVGIIFINGNGLRWRDAPAEHGPPKTLYSRWKRWSDKGIFARMMVGLTAEKRSDDIGARARLGDEPQAKHIQENRGYDEN